jgi:hypothetical protein
MPGVVSGAHYALTKIKGKAAIRELPSAHSTRMLCESMTAPARGPVHQAQESRNPREAPDRASGSLANAVFIDFTHLGLSEGNLRKS